MLPALCDACGVPVDVNRAIKNTSGRFNLRENLQDTGSGSTAILGCHGGLGSQPEAETMGRHAKLLRQ
jgi:hypothetical protein